MPHKCPRKSHDGKLDIIPELEEIKEEKNDCIKGCKSSSPHNVCSISPIKKTSPIQLFSPCEPKESSIRDSFLCGSDLDKYIKNSSFSGPYNEGTKIIQKFNEPEKCTKEDPCTSCLNAVLKNLLKNMECDKKDDNDQKNDCDSGSNNQKRSNCDSKSENNNSCKKRKKSCVIVSSASSFDNEGYKNQCSGDSSDFDCTTNKKKPNKCKLSESRCKNQSHDFCSRFAKCPFADIDEIVRHVPEAELRKCFMMKTCENENNLHFQSTRRDWLSERTVSLLASVRDRILAPIEINSEEVFTGRCCLGWQIGQKMPKIKSKYTIEPYDPLLMVRYTKSE